MAIEDRIRRFTAYFRKQVNLIVGLDGDEQLMDRSPKNIGLALQRKILFSVLLDSLAKIRYHDQNLNNTERYAGIVRDHGNWPEGDLVSTKILRDRLKEKGIDSSALVARLDASIAKVRHCHGANLPMDSMDEPFVSLEQIAKQGEETKCLKLSQHFQLFYKYRNFLVHEYREPGYGWESLADGERDPIYQVMPSGLGRGERIRLVYPLGFFQRIIFSVIESLEVWFSQNAIDPNERVKDASAWTD